MRLYILLAISSILLISCSQNDNTNNVVASPTPTITEPAETVVQPTLSPEITPSPTGSISVTPPLEEGTAEVWQEYVNEEYGFSFRYPASWTLVELAERPNRVSLVYKGTGIALRIGFKRSGEAVELQQYGGAAGDFESSGTITFLGETVEKVALVFQGMEKEIHYNGTSEISRGDIVFTLAVKSNRNYDQAVIPEEIQAAADEVLATFILIEDSRSG